jgi:hypothetical protein
MLELTEHALESDREEFTLLNPSTGRTAELTECGKPGIRFEYRKGLESIFVDRTCPDVRSILPLVLLSWVHDRTRGSREATNASVTNPSTLPRAPIG